MSCDPAPCDVPRLTPQPDPKRSTGQDLAQLAGYAVAGACVYDPAGRDGHFAWCVEVLGRADVRAALAD